MRLSGPKLDLFVAACLVRWAQSSRRTVRLDVYYIFHCTEFTVTGRGSSLKVTPDCSLNHSPAISCLLQFPHGLIYRDPHASDYFARFVARDAARALLNSIAVGKRSEVRPVSIEFLDDRLSVMESALLYQCGRPCSTDLECLAAKLATEITCLVVFERELGSHLFEHGKRFLHFAKMNQAMGGKRHRLESILQT